MGYSYENEKRSHGLIHFENLYTCEIFLATFEYVRSKICVELIHELRTAL